MSSRLALTPALTRIRMIQALTLLLLASAVIAEEAALLEAAEPIAGSYIVKLKTNADIESCVSTIRLAGGHVEHRYNRLFQGFSARLSDTLLNYGKLLPHPRASSSGSTD
ncbi:proteinase R-like [Strongylocentrotus purpuratus]|uniref:Inhibitor I9 domain-containing protein n=1 Tax=Strongylocentrotus purpuratus TaxID=7668 RepID=A0A7M7NYD4_STRPU|nr:proteinase R-like [Strongylocentrotus purpuratus]